LKIALCFDAGIGSGEADLRRCIELASRPVFLQQWKDCKHLVIDEVSMIDGLMFDKLEAVARFLCTYSPIASIRMCSCWSAFCMRGMLSFVPYIIFSLCVSTEELRK